VNIQPITEAEIDNIFDIRDLVKENHLSREEVARLGFTPRSLKKCSMKIVVDGLQAKVL
jgi:hypothetical protein